MAEILPGDFGFRGQFIEGVIPQTFIEAPGARVRNSSTISTNNSSWTLATFNTQVYDNEDIHSTSSNTSRLTCVTPGKYSISGNLSFTANTTGVRFAQILLNGTSSIAENGGDASSAFDDRRNVNTIYDLIRGDYVELRGFQSSGGSLTMSVIGVASPSLSIQRIG